MRRRNRLITFTVWSIMMLGLVLSLSTKPVNAATRSVKHGGTVTINLGDTVHVDSSGIPGNDTGNFGYTYLKFKANKTGWLRVTSPRFSGDLRLLDENKTPITKNNSLSHMDDTVPDYFISYQANNVNYGVKAGKIYYLRVEVSSVMINGGEIYYILLDKYDIKTSFKPITDIGGKRKSKAKNIKKGKKITGLLPVNTMGVRWYKIKLKKNQKLKIYMSYYGTGQCHFLVKPKKGKSYTYDIYDHNVSTNGLSGDNGKVKIIKTKNKLKKGTVVYVKICNDKRSQGGVYTLKWK